MDCAVRIRVVIVYNCRSQSWWIRLIDKLKTCTDLKQCTKIETLNLKYEKCKILECSPPPYRIGLEAAKTSRNDLVSIEIYPTKKTKHF